MFKKAWLGKVWIGRRQVHLLFDLNVSVQVVEGCLTLRKSFGARFVPYLWLIQLLSRTLPACSSYVLLVHVLVFSGCSSFLPQFTGPIMVGRRNELLPGVFALNLSIAIYGSTWRLLIFFFFFAGWLVSVLGNLLFVLSKALPCAPCFKG